MGNFGVEIRKTKEGVEAARATTETKVAVLLERGARQKPKLETTLPFLDHMLEMIWWRSGFNISVSVKAERRLEHTIAEDAGITFGKAVRSLCEAEMCSGINGTAVRRSMIDEALAEVALSIEGRAGCWVDRECEGAKAALVENMASCDLRAFLDGFSQGAGASVRVSLLKGEDPHHTWEAAFRAFGEALAEAFRSNPWRAGGIAGVKGTLE
ncbi:MAG: hypothetical protein WC759_00330 [Candidatus Micrarchaeia archaeon]|jgi:imidazoleglycerol-phosphate dehydratase